VVPFLDYYRALFALYDHIAIILSAHYEKTDTLLTLLILILILLVGGSVFYYYSVFSLLFN